jgi:tetratricopeptide (TPR) repeat protein
MKTPMARIAILFWFSLAALCAAAKSSPNIDPSAKEHGERYVEIFAGRNADAWAKAIDVDAFTTLVFEGVPSSVNEQKAAKRGFLTGFPRTAKTMMMLMERNGARPKLLRSHASKAGSVQLLRMDFFEANDSPAGYSYIKLKLNAKGELVDYLDYMTGDWATANVRMLFILSIESGNILEKVLGIQSTDTAKALKHIRAHNQAMQQRDFPLALREIRSLPKDYQDLLAVASIDLTTAQNTDETAYRKSLASLAKKFPNQPNVQLMLLDHYFYEKQFDAGIRALEIFGRDVIEDGAIALMKCVYHGEAGRHDVALTFCEQATQLEPDFRQAWDAFVRRAIKQGKHSKTMQAITGYEKQFGVKLTAATLAQFDGFDKLKTSAEYKAWSKKTR